MRPRYTPICKTHHNVIGKLIRLPLRLIPPKTRLKIPIGINRGATWVVGSGVHECWMGTYEKQIQSAIRARVRPGMIVWDVGANVGFYTVALARLVGPTGQVTAFEADGLNAAYLMQHVRINNLENVTVVQAAVYNATGIINFTIGAPGAQGSIIGESRLKIPSVSMDSYIMQGGAPPEFIKIDVEGAESEVLNGAMRFLEKHAPTMLIALHGREQQYQCERLLNRNGYTCYDLQGDPLSEKPSAEMLACKLP
jgi:FkbM family methyltransferase